MGLAGTGPVPLDQNLYFAEKDIKQPEIDKKQLQIKWMRNL